MWKALGVVKNFAGRTVVQQVSLLNDQVDRIKDCANSELKEKILESQTGVETLEARNYILQQRNERLVSKCAEIEDVIFESQTRVETLEAKNLVLSTRNERLVAEIKQLKNEAKYCNSDYSVLKKRLKTIAGIAK